MVASLIEQKFAVKLDLTAVGELLAKLGLTPQKPLERAYQSDLQQNGHYGSCLISICMLS
jgi:transposase